jgi:hypothetical protein
LKSALANIFPSQQVIVDNHPPGGFKDRQTSLGLPEADVKPTPAFADPPVIFPDFSHPALTPGVKIEAVYSN